ncbi:MAG: beta-propeller fold lactonase family protein [Acidobacteriota bacterium]|nr:beta-propeller fold lactonase family protein [Acidobacteriota bacterium]
MKRLIACIAGLCLLATMVGCGGASSTGTFAYIANKTGSGFTVYTVNSDGTLTLNNISPQTTPSAPLDLVFSANSKWAFFLDASGSHVYAYTRAGNGELATAIGSYSVGPDASSLVVSTNSYYVYVALPDTDQLAIYSIDQSTGQLTQVGSNVNIGYAIDQLVMTPGGSLLLGLSSSQQAIVSWTITSSTGVLTQVATQAVGVKPSYLALSENGSYAYVTDKSATTTVTTSSSSYTTPNIYGFTVASSGVLTAMADSPFNENADINGTYPTEPVFAVTSNDNRYLFVANQGTHNISSFKMSSTTGELTEVLGTATTVNGVTTTTASPYDCGSGCTSPHYMSIPSGNNALYVLDPAAGALFQFKIDQNTGRLRAMSPASLSGLSTPNWITLK